MSIKIGTRGSKLALAQTGTVIKKLTTLGISTEKVIITTQGDTSAQVPLHEIGGQAELGEFGARPTFHVFGLGQPAVPLFTGRRRLLQHRQCGERQVSRCSVQVYGKWGGCNTVHVQRWYESTVVRHNQYEWLCSTDCAPQWESHGGEPRRKR